jgi:hypothetical protein
LTPKIEALLPQTNTLTSNIQDIHAYESLMVLEIRKMCAAKPRQVMDELQPVRSKESKTQKSGRLNEVGEQMGVPNLSIFLNRFLVDLVYAMPRAFPSSF